LSGTIGVCAQDAGRFTEFSLALARLEKPEGWEVMGVMNYDLAHARNFLAQNFKGDHLWLMDDDHYFKPDVLRRLLAHGRELVGPLCLGRRPPFRPCPRVADTPISPGQPGLVEVDELGGAGLLIRRSVFETVEWPWFAHGPTQDGGHVSDDAYFTRKARDAGIPLLVDTSVTLAHMNVVAVEPRFEDGRWFTDFSVSGVKFASKEME
jgi:GT2 family glycosyltransferase